MFGNHYSNDVADLELLDSQFEAPTSRRLPAECEASLDSLADAIYRGRRDLRAARRLAERYSVPTAADRLVERIAIATTNTVKMLASID